MDGEGRQHTRIAIIGTGFSGIGMAIRLLQNGIRDFVLLERKDDVGGAWRDNSYPGCACDVESDLYSFSFAPNPDWTRLFAPQGEIWAYIRRVAQENGILSHIRFGHELHRAVWQEDASRWRIETSAGVFTSDILVSAVGGLSEPMIPRIEGLERFAGEVFHSAQWDHDYDLKNRRVAVIGTGASAIQFVPAIAPLVRRMDVYQRTPAWILPRVDRAIGPTERWLRRKMPALQQLSRQQIRATREMFLMAFRNMDTGRQLERLARAHLARQVRDPGLRTRLTPEYSIGCKRVLLSNDFYPALTRPNVELVTNGVQSIAENGVIDTDGTLREADTLIFGTGFHVTDAPIAKRVIGADGRSLEARWGAEGASAYLGTTIANYPNFFMLQGPNTGLGHTSILLMSEAQIEHVANAVAFLDRSGATSIEPRPEAQREFADEVQAGTRGTVWTSGGCASWYLDANGRNTTLWPHSTFAFERRVRPFDPTKYLVHYAPRPVKKNQGFSAAVSV